MTIYQLTKEVFPVEERYSLTDQIRRASRSVCANIAEAWRKRRYEAAFIAKLSDAETEAAETQVWLEVAWKHGYLTEDQFQQIDKQYEHICAQLVNMSRNSRDWIIRPEMNDAEKGRARGRGDTEKGRRGEGGMRRRGE